MTDNPADSAHENGSTDAQENISEDIPKVPESQNSGTAPQQDNSPQGDDASQQESSATAPEPSHRESAEDGEVVAAEPVEADTSNADTSAEVADQPEKKATSDGSGNANNNANGKKPANRGGGQKSKPDQPKKSVVVRYGLMRQIGEFRHNLPKYIPKGSKVVVRTERGVELGEVMINVKNNDDTDDPQESQEAQSSNGCNGCCSQSGFCIDAGGLDKFIKKCGSNYPFRRNGRVLRVANQQDIVDYRHLASSSVEEAKYARDQVKQRKLPMKLVSVEHLLGGGRIVFHFTAETRVDFRELVRDLASQFRTRIEMRQVGARDEARLVADYERCGQRCCCQEFLKDLKPVSMRMAKVQKATLDPSKISGRCSRLMCCLRYEDSTYEEFRKKLPRRNTWVRTEQLAGKIIDTQIITQLVRLYLPDGTQAIVPVEDIIERDIEPVIEQAPVQRFSKKSHGDASRNGKNGSARKGDADRRSGEGEQDGKKRSRRSRRRRKDGESGEGVTNAPRATGRPVEPREDDKKHAEHRAAIIENAPELPPLQDFSISSAAKPLPPELVDPNAESIPISELFGLEAPVAPDNVDVPLKPEFRTDETIEPKSGTSRTNSGQPDSSGHGGESSPDGEPKKKRRRRRRRRKK